MSVNYADLITKQKQHLQDQLAQLEKADITALEAKRASLLEDLEKIDAQIASVCASLGLTPSSQKAAAKKSQGVLVSVGRLMELFQEHKTKELNLRALRLDTKQIKKLVSENTDKLDLGGKGAWPTVKLKS